MEEVSDMEEASTDRAMKEQTQEINESGIGVDLNESTPCNNHNVYSTTSCLNSVTEMPSTPDVTPKTNYSLNKLSPDVSEELSFDCSGMKKDDSGIYSEKSPVCGIVKEVSDGDLTESITESFEENASLEQKCKNNSGLNDGGAFELDDSETVEKNNQVADINHTPVKEKAKHSDNSNACNINLKDTEELCDTDTFNLNGSDQQVEILEDIAYKNSDDSDVWKPASSKRVKPLVDYDSSDSERQSSREPGIDKASKFFRKRKSELNDNSDNESTGENDGTPVMLRHAEIGEAEFGGHSGLESEDNSDASDVELGAKNESSESEADDTPMELSQFGPPKHKWRALFDLRDREHGYPIRSEPGYFRKKTQGSLQMVQRFDLQYKMEKHEGCVNALHFNRSGTWLASGSDDLSIVIWDWIRNKTALVYDSGHRSNVFQSKFMPFSGDCHVVSCARDGQVRLADLSSTGVCKGTKKLAQHRGAAHKLALEMDSPHVFLSCGEDAITFEIDLRCDKANKLVITKENDRKVALYSIHSNPSNSNEFVVSGRDHFIRIYDKRKINEEVDDGLVKKFCPHHLTTGDKPDSKANVTCACYNYNGTEVLGTYNDEDIYLFSNTHSDGANYIHKYTGHRNNQTVKGVNFYGPESEFIVSGSDCGHIFLWDKATENIVKYMAGDDGGVINVLEPHPFSPVLATSGLDHDIKIWAPTGEHPFNLTGLKKLTKRNSREREQERSSDGGMVDGAMLWYLMHHLRRGRRRREREARRARGESPAEDDDDDDDDEEEEDTLSDESSHSDSDSDSGPHERIQCAPS